MPSAPRTDSVGRKDSGDEEATSVQWSTTTRHIDQSADGATAPAMLPQSFSNTATAYLRSSEYEDALEDGLATTLASTEQRAEDTEM